MKQVAVFAFLLIACGPAPMTRGAEPVDINALVNRTSALPRQWVGDTDLSDMELEGDCLFMGAPHDPNNVHVYDALEGQPNYSRGQIGWLREDGFIALQFGDDAVLRGRDGDTIELTRDSTRESAAGVRNIHQRIAGILDGQTFSGEYVYQECEPTAECPVRCTLRARMTSKPVP